MTYDPAAQARILREEVDRYEEVLQRLGNELDFHVGDTDRRSIAIFRSIAHDLETAEITDEDEARRIAYGALTVVRETREDFEMVIERLSK